MSGYMYGKSVEEVRRQKEQNARNRIALEKSRAAAAAAKRKQQESGLIYVPPAPRAPLAIVPVPLAVPAPSAPAAAPVSVAPAQIQAAFDRGISHAALIFLTDALNELIDASTQREERLVEARQDLLGGTFAGIEMDLLAKGTASEKEKISKVYFSVKKAIDTILQKKERAPGNKRWNNAHNHKHDNVEDAIVSIYEQILNLNFSDTNLRDRLQDRLSNASKILRLRGNETEVKKEFNETLLQLQQEAEEAEEAEEAVRDAPAKAKEAAAAAAAALWDATHKRLEAAKARYAERWLPPGTNVGGGKRTRRNRKNKKSRKYTRRNL
jgi:hypothetical protein